MIGSEKLEGIGKQIEKSNLGPLTTPLSQRGIPGWMIYLATTLGLVYLLDPTADARIT